MNISISPQQLQTRAAEPFQQGDPTTALEILRQALQVYPQNRELYSQLLFYQMSSPELTPPEVYAEFNKASQFYTAQSLTEPDNSREPWRRLKIAYVSGDFRNHALARVCKPLFQFYDPRYFEVSIYSNTAIADEMTDWFRQHCDHFYEIQGRSSAEVLKQIRADKIDILVDLAGHSAGCRLDLFAQRSAPVQVTAGLGIIATTGLSDIDFRLADAAIVPEGLAAYNSEEVIHLSHHLRWDPPEVLLELPVTEPPSRKNGYITFGSANRLYKLNDRVLDLWASLLRALPDSRLALKCSQLDKPEQQLRLRQAFQQRGVSSERLSFSGQTSTPEHIAWQSQIDIALDPFPYQGGLTTFEALFMGVPVVTLNYPGGSRDALSILAAMGLTDLIGSTPRQTFDIALRLAQDPAALLQLRQSLRANMLASPIFDGLGYTREIENVWRWLWLRYCRSEAPLAGSLSQAPACHPPQPPEPNPEHLARLKQWAAHYFELEHYSRCETLCREILLQSPSSHEALHLLGLLAFRFGHQDAAIALLREAITHESGQGYYHFNLGNVLAAAGRQAEAQQSWQTARQLVPALAGQIPG